MNEFDSKVVDLLEEYAKDESIISDKLREMLMEMEPSCRETSIFKNQGRSLEKSPEFLQMSTSLELLRHMCAKIAGAPTWIHAAAAPRLMIPLICESLRKEGRTART